MSDTTRAPQIELEVDGLAVTLLPQESGVHAPFAVRFFDRAGRMCNVSRRGRGYWTIYADGPNGQHGRVLPNTHASAGAAIAHRLRKGAATAEELERAFHAEMQKFNAPTARLGRLRATTARELEIARANVETLREDLARCEAQAAELQAQLEQIDAEHASLEGAEA